MKIVITGGPCSGKSTIIEQLENLGYNIVEEVALELIEEENKGDKNIYPWTDTKRFQSRVNKRQIEKEKFLDDKIHILDRSIIDSIAYMKHYNNNIPKYVDLFAKKSYYDMILFLEMLPEKYWYKTRNGKDRMHSYESGVEIHKKILSTYKGYGYKPLIISYDTIDKRMRIIKDRIDKVL